MVFYSHTNPKRKLINHLQEVVEYSIRYGDESLTEIHKIIGYAHDFGKYTTYFQDDRLFKKKSWGDKANHAYLSAVFGAFLCLKNDKLSQSLFPLLTFSSILSHHGDIKEFSSLDYLSYSPSNRAISEKFKVLNSQIENMKNNLGFILRDFSEIGLEKKAEEFLTTERIIINVINELEKRYMSFEEEPDENQFWMHQILYSSLISADKMSAAGLTPVKEKHLELSNLISKKDDIIRNAKKSKLNKFRNEIFDKVLSKLREVYKDSSIFSITAPTGTGKTYTGFFCAKVMQELLGGRHKIIYALPFTSIIDQNYKKIEELHNVSNDFESNKSCYLIKHHHLSNMEYINEKEDYRNDQAELLIENWDSGVIITTFVQLLQTLIGNRNRMLKKYHVLTKSIILLDEVQAIPIEYFELVSYAFQKLVDIFDCKIIFMTATKPIIFPNATELLEESEQYFSKMQRTTLIPKLNKITIEQFCDDFLKNKDPEKSYLIVCNTIAQSLKVYNHLSNFGEKKEYIYLSTNLLPLHRREVLNRLEALQGKEKYTLVSTQVVEAGVDLDFDEVIRDIAPLDSIIQCAGRCNRNSNNENGNISIVNMVNDKGYTFASKVYGAVIVKITRELFSNKTSIPEKEYSYLIQEYFERITSGKISMQKSKDLIKAIGRLDFDKEHGVGSFSLTEDKQDYIDLYIEYDACAETLIHKLQSALLLTDETERRNLLKNTRRKMLAYTISIPIKFAKRYKPVSYGGMDMFIIEKNDVGRHYNKTTGLKRDEDFDMFCY